VYDLLETSLGDRHVAAGYYRNTEDLLKFLNKGVADRVIALTMVEGKVVVAIASDFIVGFVPLSTYGVGEHIEADLTVKNVETLFVYKGRYAAIFIICNHEAQGDDMYEDYYTSQSGLGMPVFAGARYQHGHGLGSILSGLFRRIILPFFRANGRTMASKAIKTGLKVADDV